MRKLLLLALAACGGMKDPGSVADKFVDRYYVESDQEHIDIQFLENLEGYIWIFPRSGHTPRVADRTLQLDADD